MNNNQLIIKTIMEYYQKEINGRMPYTISPYEDPDLVCCVVDKINKGTFNLNVVYGKGQQFSSNVESIISALRWSSNFKETSTTDDKYPIFTYVNRRKNN